MKILDVLTGMALPRVCEVCGRELVEGEDFLCLHCRAGMRATLILDAGACVSRLPRAARVEQVVSLLPYSHTHPLCVLIRKGKYNGRPDLIEGLARIYAEMLVAERALEGVDVLMPVGMHWLKRMRRGYNQAEVIARTVGGMAGIEVGRAVRARRWHGPQARNTATARMENVRGMFAPVYAQSLAGLHVAIVDDILTTGATMSEAIRAVMPGMPKAISVLTLAITNN